MTWLDPLASLPPNPPAGAPQPVKTPNRSRPVVIEGKRYASMYQARKALRCSYSKIYYLIGERYRFRTGGK